MFQNAWLFESEHVFLIVRTCGKGSGDEPFRILHQHDFGDAMQTHSSRKSNAGSCLIATVFLVDTMSL